MFDLNTLNSIYSLGLWKKDYVVGMWINNNLITQDGMNKKICSRKEQTKYKHFVEAQEFYQGNPLKIGNKVASQSKEGKIALFYVVMQLSNGSYIIAR